MQRVLIAGASGIVGSAAARRFGREPGWDVLAVSRKRPLDLPAGVRHLALDLSDREACATALAEIGTVTHIVYAAVAEEGSAALGKGWRDTARMDFNLHMLQNLVEPLRSGGLRHISVMQGMKAYGVHVDPTPPEMPLREARPRHSHANFYWLQEDYVRGLAAESSCTWTVFRPPMIVGDAVASNLNVLLALGAYAALQRQAGEPFAYPGTASPIAQALDADLLADAFLWAADNEAAANQIFNIENGEAFAWRDIWKVIAAATGLEAGDGGPPSLTKAVPSRAADWTKLVRDHDLAAPTDLVGYLGASFALADMCLGSVPYDIPGGLMSTIKLRKAGFNGCVDTEEMVWRWLARFRELRLLPPVKS